MKDNLRDAIIEALKVLGLPSTLPFVVEHPADMSHGDYATNVALAYAKEAGKNPRELAGQIMDTLVNLEVKDVAAYEIAGPGFINIHLAAPFFKKTIDQIITDADYGKSNIHAGKKILVEHSSPNLFKPFHIGHFMNNAVGESLVRLMQYSGAKVSTMSFPSDVSIGIAKAIFVLLEKYGNDFTPTEISVLGDAYVEGTKRYDEDESIHARVKEIADNLYAQKDSPEWKLYKLCKEFNIAYFESVTGKLGSHFDSYIYESQAGEAGKKIVADNTPIVFTESEGAIVYIPAEEKKNINTAVFINSQGNPTYEAKDLGLLSMKFNNENPDLSIFVTDYQQIPHFNVVLDAAEKINKEWVEKSVHIAHGRMAFKGQKMSSRLGGVPLATELIDVVKEEALVRAQEKGNVDSAESVAIAALKFAILRSEAGKSINFDPETSLSFEGDSGPYLQYTHARLASLLEKAQAEGLQPNNAAQFSHVSMVHQLIYRFPEVVRDAIVHYAPHEVTMYLLELAHAFNSYYGANKIIDADDKQGTENRLALVAALKTVFKNGLHLLAIQAPDRM